MIYGYARISRPQQSIERQIRNIKSYNENNSFFENLKYVFQFSEIFYINIKNKNDWRFRRYDVRKILFLIISFFLYKQLFDLYG